jgi:uncharacterized membrane protein YfcA
MEWLPPSALLMLMSVAATWRKAGASATAAERTADAARPPLRFARDLGTGLLVGALTGCFGVGGGFPIVQRLGFLALSMRQVA